MYQVVVRLLVCQAARHNIVDRVEDGSYMTHTFHTVTLHVHRWGSRTVWIEMFVVTNNKPLSMEHYQGLYMGGEKIARGKRRVDVNKYDPLVDITGA